MTQPNQPGSIYDGGDILSTVTTATPSTEPVAILGLFSVLGQALVALLAVVGIVVAPALLPAILAVAAALIPIIQVVVILVQRSKVSPVK